MLLRLIIYCAVLPTSCLVGAQTAIRLKTKEGGTISADSTGKNPISKSSCLTYLTNPYARFIVTYEDGTFVPISSNKKGQLVLKTAIALYEPLPGSIYLPQRFNAYLPLELFKNRGFWKPHNSSLSFYFIVPSHTRLVQLVPITLKLSTSSEKLESWHQEFVKNEEESICRIM